MTELDAIKESIRYLESVKTSAIITLDEDGISNDEIEKVQKQKIYAEFAINALRRFVPKKPTQYLTSDNYPYYKCSCCGYIDVDEQTYCSSCGQKLDWGED